MLPTIGEAIAMTSCASEIAPAVVVRLQPSSFSRESMIWLTDERAEKDTARAKKQTPTMIQAARSRDCREDAAIWLSGTDTASS